MERRQRLIVWGLGLLLAANLTVGLALYWRQGAARQELAGQVQAQQISRVLRLIRQEYVDPERADYEALGHGAIRGMTNTLDTFSSFIPRREHDSLTEQTRGEFGGIGVVISRKGKDPDLTILSPMEGSPGARAGLLPNDRIVKVDGQDVSAMSQDEAIAKIKGPEGTSVNLTVFRPATKETRQFSITRAVIEIDTVLNARMAAPAIGYLWITGFSDRTAGSLGRALKKLHEQGMKCLVMDLRNNPGGTLEAAVAVCSYFVPEHKLVVSAEFRRPEQSEQRDANDGPKYLDLPVVILTNENSASAAEIVAGCLQDYRIATLVGDKTFGKGSVQKVFPLADGSAVRLTVAKYYTPSRRVIHGHGLEPDTKVQIGEEDTVKIYSQLSRRLPGNSEHPEPGDIPDVQLQKALEAAAAKLAAAARPAPSPLPPAATPAGGD